MLKASMKGSLRGIGDNVLDCDIIVGELKLESCYMFIFRHSWERYEPPYPPSYRLNDTNIVLLQGWLLEFG